MRALLLVCLLFCVLSLAFTTACASGPPGTSFLDGGGWTESATEAHPALAADTTLVWWSRGRGVERRTVGGLRTADGDTRPGDLAELRAHSKPIDGPTAAARYADLAQRLGMPGVAVDGQALRLADDDRDRGGSGVFTHRDAAAWGFDPDEPPLPAAGGWHVRHLVLVAPLQHPELSSFISPWRVVLVESIVYPDGALTGREERTLTNGDDAARFARF